MNIIDAILNRKSIRQFLPQDVDLDIIKKILNTAKYSPSGTNTQPWSVAVVGGVTKKLLDEKLTNAFWSKEDKQPDYKYYPDVFSDKFQKNRIECGEMLYNSLGIKRDDKDARLKQWAKNYSCFDAPITIYVFTEKNVNQGSFMDCGMFIQSIMLSAMQYNLSSCPEASLAEYPHIVRDVLQIPEDKILLCGIALGYANTNAKVNQYRTSRDNLEDFTSFYN